MGISVWQLLIILGIVLVLFGAKRLRTLGTDLGSSVKGFRDAMKDGEKQQAAAEEEKKLDQNLKDEGRVIDAEVELNKSKDGSRLG